MSLLVATGLQREARLLSAPGVVVIAGGGRAAALEARLAQAAPDASAILSLGLAGALAGDLAPGDWVVAEAVVTETESFAADEGWRARLASALPRARAGRLLGSDAMVTEAADKRAAHARTGALAVDMESQVAARVARRFALPFAAARVISDAADRSLPPAVRVGMRPDGGMAPGAVLWALARQPGQLPALIRTATEAGVAFRALPQVRPALLRA